MKKNILITTYSMGIGGVERSLLGFLNAFDYSKYDVSLMIFNHDGELMKYIPSQVNVLPYNLYYDVFQTSLKKILFSRIFYIGILRIFARIHCYFNLFFRPKTKVSKVWIKQQYNTKYILPFLPAIKGDYNLCISFVGIHSIILKKVKAKNKVGWIHTDYDMLVSNRKFDLDVYKNLNKIVFVSDGSCNTFLKHYPQFKDNTLIIENIVSSKLLKTQADEFDASLSMNAVNTKLLSIGRFGYAKNFDNIPDICRRILDLGGDITWYIIGYGQDESIIRENIERAGVKENVIILGKQTNPYPFIKACDIYVQPSRYEGKSVAVREAQVLCRPVVITNYPSAKSQVSDGVDGVIVPLNNSGCADGILHFINNEVKQEAFIDYYCSHDMGQEKEVDKVYNLCS